jgi:hypothetical protein
MARGKRAALSTLSPYGEGTPTKGINAYRLLLTARLEHAMDVVTSRCRVALFDESK